MRVEKERTTSFEGTLRDLRAHYEGKLKTMGEEAAETRVRLTSTKLQNGELQGECERLRRQTLDTE